MVKTKKTRKTLGANGALAMSLMVLVAVVAAVGFTLFSITRTVGDLRTEVAKTTPDAKLASANLDKDTTVTVPVVYYDQKMDTCGDIYNIYSDSSRQFEWSTCDFLNRDIETGLVESRLSEDYLPVALGGEKLANRAVKGGNFTRWFTQVDGLSKSFAGNLAFDFDVEKEEFHYINEGFYPLDTFVVDKSESVNKDGHNHLFTMNLGVPFQALLSGEEEFEITADDDTWVFVGDKLVIDMGGVHEATSARFMIHENGEVYSGVGAEDLAYAGVKLNANDSMVVRIFHADRDSESSVLKLKFHKMVLNVTESKIAQGGDSVQVAYDPANPSYVAPLGESMTFTPDRSNSMLAAAITETLVLSVLMVVFVVVMRVVLKKARA